MRLFQLLIYICLGRCVAEGTGDIVRGYGTIEFKDGAELVGGKVQVGLLKFADGHMYKGEVKDGRAHGKGNMTFVGGDTYEGDYVQNKKHGKGIYEWVSGAIYEGEWKSDKRNGVGILTWSDGKYDGDWKDGKQHGKGTFKHVNGDSYNGDWKDDRAHGMGILTWSDGKYDGDWKDGKQHGKGTFKHVNGDFYDGDWKDNKRHGNGTLKYVNGDIYDGEWKSDKKHGHGEYTHANCGTVYKGKWMSDTPQGKVKVTDSMCVQFIKLSTTGKEIYSIFVRWLIMLREWDCIRPNSWTFVIYLLLGIASASCQSAKSPSCLEKKGTGEKKAAVVLTDEHKSCSICFEPFSMDMGTTNDNARKHLPVVGLCHHYYCHGCILKRQSSLAQKKRNGEVPEVISCMECRKRGAFRPSNPTYHRMLIGLLERSIPIVTEEDKK